MDYGVLDLVSTDPPRKADMIIVKEVLQHLPLKMGVKMLQHAKHAGVKFLAVTTDKTFENRDIEMGGLFYGPDVEAPPYNMKDPLESCTRAPINVNMKLFDLRSQGEIR